jgi:hypothetical protein
MSEIIQNVLTHIFNIFLYAQLILYLLAAYLSQGDLQSDAVLLGAWVLAFRRNIVKDSSILQDQGTMFLQDVGHHSPTDTASHPSGPESSAMPLQETQNLITCTKFINARSIITTL